MTETTEHTGKVIRLHPLKILLGDITLISTECKSNVILKHALMESHKVQKEWNLHHDYLVLTRLADSNTFSLNPLKAMCSYARFCQTLCNILLKSAFYFLFTLSASILVVIRVPDFYYFISVSYIMKKLMLF